MKYLFSFFIACSFLAGCSSSISDTGSEQAEIRPVDSLELYISRKSLTKTEFEQFKFADGQIYGECGTIVGGRYYPTLQDIRPSSSDSARAIASASDSVLDMAAAEDFHLDSPGKNTSLFDPGQFLLSLQEMGKQSALKLLSTAFLNQPLPFKGDLWCLLRSFDRRPGMRFMRPRCAEILISMGSRGSFKGVGP